MTFFESPVAFFGVYIPLVLIAACSIIFEDQFIAFEDGIKKEIKRRLRAHERKKEDERR